MKKLISFLLISCVILCPVFADDIEQEDIRFGETISHGAVLYNTNIVKVTTAVQDGRPIALTVVPGSPTLLNILDLNTGDLIDAKVVPESSSASWMNDTNSKGDVYFGSYTNARLYRYSPETKELSDLGPVVGEGAVISMTFDEDGNVYMGTYPGAKIVKYDITEGNITVLDIAESGGQYLTGLAYYEGALYYQYKSNNQGLYKYVLETGAESLIPYKENTLSGGETRLFVRGDLLVAAGPSAEEGLILLNYNLKTNQWTDIYAPNFRGTFVTPVLDGYYYYPNNGYIYSYNMSTGETINTQMSYGSYFRGNNFGWVELDDPDFPGKNYVNCAYEGHIQILNFETKRTKAYEDKLMGVASETRANAFGPDGRFYVGEYMGTKAAALNVKTGDVELFHMSQPEAMVSVGDKMYFGNYTNGELYILDTKKPYYRTSASKDPNNNPRIWGAVGGKLDRPTCMIEAEGKVVMGGVPDYGVLGGPLIIYDPDTDEVDVYEGLVENQMIIDIAYLDGKLYCATSASGGLDIIPTETQAKIFVFDMQSRVKTNETDLLIPGVETPIRGIEGITVGPDGSLIGIGRMYLYKIDPDTLALLDYNTFQGPAYGYGNGMQIWMPYSMVYDEEFCVYFTTFNGFLGYFDPDTLEYTITDIEIPFKFQMGPDGNIYYVDEQTREVMTLPVIRGKIPYAIESINHVFVTDEDFYDNNGDSITGFSSAVAFGRAKMAYGDYVLKEYGILLSKTKITNIGLFNVKNAALVAATGDMSMEVALPNKNGLYGMRFYGTGLKIGMDYCAVPYAIYENSKTGELTTLYGDSIIEWKQDK